MVLLAQFLFLSCVKIWVLEKAEDSVGTTISPWRSLITSIGFRFTDSRKSKYILKSRMQLCSQQI
jgi:hypothetical protein